MLSKDFIDTHPTNTSLGQVHQRGGPTGTAGGLASFPPLIQIDARSGSFFLIGTNLVVRQQTLLMNQDIIS